MNLNRESRKAVVNLESVIKATIIGFANSYRKSASYKERMQIDADVKRYLDIMADTEIQYNTSLNLYTALKEVNYGKKEG